LVPQVETSQGNRMGTVTDLVVNFGVEVWEGVRIRGLEVSVSGRLQEVCDT
jgi:sporulation protein YlmC with PRC-barrel domain